jgi:hypothetical protein
LSVELFLFVICYGVFLTTLIELEIRN